MAHRGLTHFPVERSGQDASAGIVGAQLLAAEVDRPKRIDRYIDYFGSGRTRRLGVTLDPCGVRRVVARRKRRAVSAGRRLYLRRALRGLIGVAMLWALPIGCALQSAPSRGRSSVGAVPGFRRAGRPAHQCGERWRRRAAGFLRRTRPRLIASKRFVTFTDLIGQLMEDPRSALTRGWTKVQ